MENDKIKLSVLDQSPIRKGSDAIEALKETTALASYTEELGYYRFWVSEHHNTSALAGSAPEILLAHIGNHTKKMRIGSGGVMLPNHNTLKIVESFRLLEALFPSRIDIGIGRAPGTDQLTASLLNPTNTFDPRDFLDQLYDLDKFFHNAKNKGSIFESVKATPIINVIPEQWLLTSSGESAMFAAHFGLSISFAHFINPNISKEAIDGYKKNFRPSVNREEPRSNVAVLAFCSEDKEKVYRQQALMDYRFIQIENKRSQDPISYEDIKDYKYNSSEKERIKLNRARAIIGTPQQVKDKMDTLIDFYDTREVLLLTFTETAEDKRESYRLFAEMYCL